MAGRSPGHDRSGSSTRFRAWVPCSTGSTQNLEITTAQVQAWLVDGSQTLFQQLASYGGVAFLGAIGTVLSFTVMLFILFFIIRDGQAIARLGSALVPLPPERREALADRLSSVTRAVVRGTALTSIIQGLLLGIGFALIGMPAPVVFGVLAAVLSVVPFGGTALVWVPALMAVLVQGSYGQAVGITGRRHGRQQRRQLHQADADLRPLAACRPSRSSSACWAGSPHSA